MNEQSVEYASSPAAERLLTRKEQAIWDAIGSGADVSAVIKREEAIEQAEHDRKMRLLELAG